MDNVTVTVTMYEMVILILSSIAATGWLIGFGYLLGRKAQYPPLPPDNDVLIDQGPGDEPEGDYVGDSLTTEEDYTFTGDRVDTIGGNK